MSPRPGDSIDNPITGERLVFRQTGSETAGALLEADYFLKPSGAVAVEHLHPRQEERFEVVSGSVVFRVDGQDRRCGPGEVAVVAPGVAHKITNPDGEEAHLRIELRPAMRSDLLLATLWGLARDARTNARGVPGLLQMATTVAEFRDEIYAARPPVVLQKIAAAALAPLGRLLGYSATVPG